MPISSCGGPVGVRDQTTTSVPLRLQLLSPLLNAASSIAGVLEDVRRLVALQNGRLILPRAGTESRSETEKELLPIAACAKETRDRVYERRVLEPVISTHDRHVSDDFSRT